MTLAKKRKIKARRRWHPMRYLGYTHYSGKLGNSDGFRISTPYGTADLS